MSRLLRRIKRAHRTADDDARAQSPDTEPSAAAAHEASAEDGSRSPLSAGQDPADVRPTALGRGRLRKRLRFLERERELLLRDLGGLVYEIHRTGAPADREHHRELVSSKVQRLSALDGEHGAGLAGLRETRGETILREPGIGGLCPQCGEIFGSDARFCPACGTRVSGPSTAVATSPVTTAPETSDLVLPAPGGTTPPTAPVTAADKPASGHRSGDSGRAASSAEHPGSSSHRATDAVTETEITPNPPPGSARP